MKHGTDARKSNLVLLGFMGTGKSTVGRSAATQLGLDFIDMDDEIERRQGCAISEIFAREGEAAFRRYEHALALELGARQGLVIATGGGLVLDPSNTDALGRHGVLVRLCATVATILERVAQESHRPLLERPDRVQALETLLRRREPLYAALPHQVVTDRRSPEDITAEVVRRYRTATGRDTM